MKNKPIARHAIKYKVVIRAIDSIATCCEFFDFLVKQGDKKNIKNEKWMKAYEIHIEKEHKAFVIVKKEILKTASKISLIKNPII